MLIHKPIVYGDDSVPVSLFDIDHEASVLVVLYADVHSRIREVSGVPTLKIAFTNGTVAVWRLTGSSLELGELRFESDSPRWPIIVLNVPQDCSLCGRQRGLSDLCDNCRGEVHEQ